MKKALREKQTLRAGCSKEPKIFAPLHTPFLGVRDGQNLITWIWSLPLPTNPVWWGSMHAILTYHGNKPTNTHPPTHRQDRLQYTALQLASSEIKDGIQPFRLYWFFCYWYILQWNKRSEETQTLRASCSKAEPKNFAQPQTPSRGRGMAKI